MRNQFLFWSVAGPVLALALGGLAGAQEKPASGPAAEYAKLAENGPGIYKVEHDKAGRVVSLLAVGQARIPEVLRDAKGMELVRRRAQLSACGEYIAWLKSDTAVKADEEKGTEHSAKSAEAGLDALQDFELVYQRADPKTKDYTVVLRFVAAR